VPNSQAPAHWSKDFVEHLRLVHLTLVAVSVGIVIIVMSAIPYKPAVAVRELHQILELKKLWSVEWILDHSDHEFIPYDDKGGNSNTLESHSVFFLSNASALEASVAWPSKQLDYVGGELFDFPKDNWVVEDPVHEKVTPTSFPTMLGEFEQWWNELNQPLEIYFPCAVIADTSFPKDDTRPVGGIHVEDFTFDRTKALPKNPLGHLRIQHSLNSDFTLNMNSYSYSLLLIRPGHPTTAYDASILITRTERTRLDQKNLGTFFGNWKPGEFKHSFSDLKQAAQDFDSLELEDVEKILDAEAAKGVEVVEVLGIKIPVGQITIWGTVVILGVQIYLCLFLKQLNGKLRPDDAGWDVPWIGMNQTNLARSVLFLTLSLLPCVALALLGGRAILQMTTDYRDQAQHFWQVPALLKYNHPVLGKIAVILIAIGSASALAALSWKYRPQIAPEPPEPPSCPAQLFE